MPRCGLRLLLATLLVLGAAIPAFADATVFIGSASAPTNRTAKGLALGAGLVIVGFELEFSDTGESVLEGAPQLRTGMGNILLQTPIPIAGIQFYFTTGGGVYREQLDTRQETHVGVNTGGGVKIALLGPVRARLDYRLFNLRGDPLYNTVHRIYAGVNVAF